MNRQSMRTPTRAEMAQIESTELERLEELDPTESALWILEERADAQRRLALCAIGLKRGPDVIRGRFFDAATAQVWLDRALRQCDLTEDDEAPNLWWRKRAIDLIVGFGSPQQVAELESADEAPYLADDPQAPPALRMALPVYRVFASRGRLELEALRKLERHLDGSPVDEATAAHIPILMSGLTALATGDADGWTRAVTTEVEYHRNEASHGRWRDRVESLACLEAIALHQLGVRRGFLGRFGPFVNLIEDLV